MIINSCTAILLLWNMVECIFTRNSQAPSRSGSLLLRVSLDFDLERGIRGVPMGVTPGVLNPLTPSFSSTGRGLSCSMLWVRRLWGMSGYVYMYMYMYMHVHYNMWHVMYIYMNMRVSVRDSVYTTQHALNLSQSLSLSLSLCILFLPTSQLLCSFEI